MLTTTMMLGWATAAQAQTRGGGIELNPNYTSFLMAVNALDDVPLAVGTRYIPQIGPAMIGIVKIGGIEIGRQGCITAPGGLVPQPNFLEVGVLKDLTADLFLSEFAIEYPNPMMWTDADRIYSDTVAGLNDWIGTQVDADVGAMWLAAEMSLVSASVPTGVMLGGTNGITPGSEDDLHLYGFELKQNGVRQGWLLRQLEFHVDSTVIVDHWLFKSSYNRIDQPGESVQAFPANANTGSISAFFAAAKAAGGLKYYYQTTYEWVPLSSL
ncbi:MAG: hypothetical protein ABMB14_38470 [Myxococcota bacterium]